jgi:glycosyltransferase involved in cell wall biosynthesis
VNSKGLFVVATPGRSVCDDNARALEKAGRLRCIALGTRRGISGVPPERTRLNPWIGLCAYAAVKSLSPFAAESFRFRLLPWFDHWVLKGLRAGDHLISSYGYTNECFKFVRKNGGKTLVDAGNSHPGQFWETISEEHRRWNCPYPPVSPFWHCRSMKMLEDTDYILSPSSFVTRSFIERGFRADRILTNAYPVDLTCFRPAKRERPPGRALTIISTGSLSLRKGSPYMLEAFRIVQKSVPQVRFLLTQIVEDSVKNIIREYGDLNIEWSPRLPHAQLANRLRGADIFVLPSLEEGLARTALEALACGLPVIVTPNTGADELVTAGVNGEIVPIRDPNAIAAAIFALGDKVTSGSWKPCSLLDPSKLSFDHFSEVFVQQLKTIGLV